MAPFDREGALKRAEKALRLGRVDAAIEEYQGIVLAQPRDWNSANALGDLFVRSGQLDKGVEQYTRIADHLAEEGFYPKASALYKKILKVKPTEEYALIRSGDVAAKLGLLADAKSAYQTVADRRRKAGNVRGAAEMAVRLGTIDPEDFDARYAAAKAARELGDDETALRELRAAAVGFEDKARHDLARAAYRDILDLQPGDEDARARVLAANIATGEFSSAFALASSPEELRQLAVALESAGQQSEVLSVWARIADLDPSDVEARVRLVRGNLGTGDTVAARRHLSVEAAAQDPSLWMALAEAELRQGRFEDGKAAVASALAANPGQREAAIAMACRLAEQSPDSAYPGIEAVTDAALAEGDYAAGRGPARVRHPGAPSHRGADAAGRDSASTAASKRRCTPRRRSWPTPTSTPGVASKRASSAKIWWRASRGTAPTSSASGAPSRCSARPTRMRSSPTG